MRWIFAFLFFSSLAFADALPPLDTSLALQDYMQRLVAATDQAVAAETRVQMMQKQIDDLQKQLDKTNADLKAAQGTSDRP